MEHSLLPFVILNLVINSLMAYVTAVLLVAAMIMLFRITNPRVKSFLSIVPIIKMPLDLMWASWSNWALLHQIYPWDCPEGTRILSAFLGCAQTSTDLIPFPLKIGFSVSDGYSFSLADLIAFFIGRGCCRLITIILLAATGICYFVRGFCLYRHSVQRRTMLLQCTLSPRPICSHRLNTAVKHYGLSILVHEHSQKSPFLIGWIHPKIIFPKKLLEILKQDEYEAVIAHELEHAKKKDSLTRTLITYIKTLFWWIPMAALIRSVEENQEMACDRSAAQYQRPVSLASALVKTAKQACIDSASYELPLLRKGHLKRRVENLLIPPSITRWTMIQNVFFTMASCLALVILFGKLWWL
ncbi:MAG: M56 family metallopeptidase [Waddliaceae bacterium]